MKKLNGIALSLALVSSQAIAGQEAAVLEKEVQKGTSLFDSIHPFGNVRLRYEYADIEGLDRGTVASLRTRVGLKTDSIYGFTALAEGEYTWILTDTDDYSAFPGFTGNGKSVIGDPDNLELNRLQLSYDAKVIDTKITVGRQYITLSDQRFVGAIGWRQNDQTFDAAVIENKSIKNLTATYAYINQVNRIFGERTPAVPLGRFESGSHLIHLEYSGITDHKVRGFAYLLDFGNAAANSTNTYGLELEGKREINSESKLNYLFTAALQNDAGGNPASYEEYYFRGQVGVKNDAFDYGVGAEVMTSDGNGGRFRVPLGTNHKFNGVADAFLTTPANGLVDYYTWVGAKAFGFKHALSFHKFETQRNSRDLGWEVDYVVARKICDNAKVLLKAAYLDGEANNQKDITRVSTEINYSF